MTPLQLDASANAPWTSTTVGESGLCVASDMGVPFGRCFHSARLRSGLPFSTTLEVGAVEARHLDRHG
jgi:hypothetical protein